MFSTKFWEICRVTMDQNWTGFGGAVELCDFKGVEMKCKLSNASMAPVQTILDFDLFFI